MKDKDVYGINVLFCVECKGMCEYCFIFYFYIGGKLLGMIDTDCLFLNLLLICGCTL